MVRVVCGETPHTKLRQREGHARAPVVFRIYFFMIVTLHRPVPVCLFTPESSLGLLGTPQLAAAAGKSLQSCPTLCDPIDGSPLGSAIPGILQARTLEWVAISFSSA